MKTTDSAAAEWGKNSHHIKVFFLPVLVLKCQTIAEAAESSYCLPMDRFQYELVDELLDSGKKQPSQTR